MWGPLALGPTGSDPMSAAPTSADPVPPIPAAGHWQLSAGSQVPRRQAPRWPSAGTQAVGPKRHSACAPPSLPVSPAGGLLKKKVDLLCYYYVGL